MPGKAACNPSGNTKDKPMNVQTRIFVAGHEGMVGSAVVRQFRARGFQNLIVAPRRELDLCDAAAVRRFLADTRPEGVIVAAAKVGGIHANNTYPAEFIYSNLSIALNMVHESWRCGVPRVVFLGSTCIYPRMAPQPIPESALLTGPLEPTNEAYAVAKIAGLKLCQYYRKQYGVLYHSIMPTNLYGPGDHYDPMNAHVLPALIRRFHEAVVSGASRVTVWGSGSPTREFLYVDDLAEAVLHVAGLPDPPDWVNAGSGMDLPICEVVEKVCRVVGYRGEVVYDRSKPDGTPRKRCDSTALRSLGWEPRHTLDEGLALAYADFCRRLEDGTLRGL